MDNLGYLFAAFTIVWVLLFYYVVRMNKRQTELMREIESLKEQVQKKT